MINIRKMVLASFLGAATFGAVIVGSSHFATAEEAAYEVPDGPVQAFGQTLDPTVLTLPQNSDHSVYKWSQLKAYMPEVLPEAMNETKTREELCDHMHALYRLYVQNLEVAEEQLIADAVSVWNDNAAYEVTDRLQSPSSKALTELLEKMPEHEGEIMMLKSMTVKYLTLSMLHDAALNNCPIYASQKGYNPVTSYDGPDKDLIPEQCKQDDAPEWCN